MKGLLFPQIKRYQFLFILRYAFIGTILAALYGIIHDQITFTISPEYFTKMKFKQFSYADFHIGDRFFVATIGALATWWVGFFIGWFLSRSIINSSNEITMSKKIKLGFTIVFLSAIIISSIVALYTFLIPDFYDYRYWKSTLDYYNIKDSDAFIRVAFIHYASYLGGIGGLIIAFLTLKVKRFS
ncbi:MAG: hypothetical protein EOO52_06705 [Gammaproteobacteria bacterium]|nr:MAG: hypothetical protein EOO52_06705 [Gammaproteobacteria bacterium]